MEINSIFNKTVLVRVGFDIPNLNTLDRIKSSFETINTLLRNKNKIVLISKWGRPDGVDLDLSFIKIVEILNLEFNKFLYSYLKPQDINTNETYDLAEQGLNHDIKIHFVSQFEEGFSKAKNTIDNLPFKSIVLLENIYFDSNEFTINSEDRLQLASQYAKLADVFVDECFISSHRNDATNTEIKEFLPHTLGFHYEKEVNNLSYFLKSPIRPFILVLGGAKLATKLPLLESLLPKVDKVMLGGTICFPFLNVMKKIKTNCSQEELNLASNIIEKYKDKLVLATDFVPSLNNAKDIGPNSIQFFKEHLLTAKSVFWNGPLGQYEQPEYAKGTLEIAEFISNLGVHAVLGGGDSVAAIPENILNKFTFVSSGGGATLEFLSRGCKLELN